MVEFLCCGSLMNPLIGKKILVVDDVEAERMLISTYLQGQGCRVYLAADGIDAIHKARLLIPDLILMDFDMPRCDGVGACKVLTQDPKTVGVPVIFLSAFATPEDRVKGLLAGAVDYIGKPFDFDEVRLRLAVHLRVRDEQPSGSAIVNITTTHPDIDGSEFHGEAEPKKGVSHLDGILFHSARIHLLKSLDQAPSLQELASMVGTNSKRLNAAFRACAGVTVYEYLREERMQEARQLLLSTQYSLSDVACRVGFTSGANFATAFKVRFGTSPSRFRKRANPHADG
ncbi:MAG: DNA-binding response regulator [Chromatiaceae bacterium]|nr:MAG: DNA-binding response regulator [Chromatiaceae bacterium]